MGSDNHDDKKKNERQFVCRKSLLTELAEVNPHIRTVYHLFLFIFITLFINTVAYDYLKNGKISLGLNVIKLGFKKIHLAFVTLFGHAIASCLAYYIFGKWIEINNYYIRNKKIWKTIGLTILLIYYFLNFAAATYILLKYKFPIGSAAIVAIDQTRLLMKVHAFVRSNVHKQTVPVFKHFLYFLIAPTLLYRDNYPKTKNIDWSFVFWRLVEVVGCILGIAFVTDRLLNPTVQDFGLRKFKTSEIFLAILDNVTSGSLLLLTQFFLLLHSWQNMFAEVTYFGDRMFYADWWTSTNFSQYFRKWNNLVQEWIHKYVYKEFHSKVAVVAISAFVHEWVLTVVLGSFFPMLFLTFSIAGYILMSLKPPKTPLFNLIFLFFLFFGSSFLYTLYAIEFYARINAPVVDATVMSYIVPRFLTCNCIE